MPRKGGGPQEPPETTNELVQTAVEGPLPGSLDRTAQIKDGPDDELEFVYGDIVHDEEVEEPDDRVVVNLPPVRADEWELDEGTLADLNPTCPEHDPIVITVTLRELNDYLPDWDEREEEIPLEQLVEDDVPAGVHPSLRLELVEESHLRED